jgi:hypothetical protein
VDSGILAHVFDAAEVAELTRKAAGADVSFADDAVLLAAAVELESARASLDAAAGHVLGELEARGVCDRDLGVRTASWLAHVTHGSRPAIASRVRVATKLRQLGVTDDALADGAISVDHARVLADAAANPRVQDRVVELQAELVELAQRCPFPAWRTHVTRTIDLLDQDGGFDPARDLARNHLHIAPLFPDGLRLSGELIGEHALTVSQALEAETDRLWRRYRNDAEHTDDLTVPTRPTLRALALAELIRKATATDLETTSAPTVDITLVVHADSPEVAHTVDGTPLRSDTTRHLCCDARYTPLITGRDGVPLKLGRELRYATRAQRRALAVRDGGCVFPGCDLPATWTDAHHVTPWEAGGLTDMANLASLCRHHHGVTHRTAWTMTAQPDQTFVWTTPSGDTLESQRNRGSPAP